SHQSSNKMAHELASGAGGGNSGQNSSQNTASTGTNNAKSTPMHGHLQRRTFNVDTPSSGQVSDTPGGDNRPMALSMEYTRNIIDGANNYLKEHPVKDDATAASPPCYRYDQHLVNVDNTVVPIGQTAKTITGDNKKMRASMDSQSTALDMTFSSPEITPTKGQCNLVSDLAGQFPRCGLRNNSNTSNHNYDNNNSNINNDNCNSPNNLGARSIKSMPVEKFHDQQGSFQSNYYGDGNKGFRLGKNITMCNGLYDDFTRRLSYYWSDYADGIRGPKTMQKTLATIMFLYFGCLLPIIAFSVLNSTNTDSHLGVIYTMCTDYGYSFPAMYAAVGLWNGIFLAIYAVFDVSKLMKYCTRSTEEIFALFIAIAFAVDAGRDVIESFNKYYYSNACTNATRLVFNASQDTISNLAALRAPGIGLTGPFMMQIGPITTRPQSDNELVAIESVCRRETSVLFVLLMFGTLWLASTLYNFNRTPYLQASKRELLADYALPAAVIIMSFVGSYVFEEIYVDHFKVSDNLSFERSHIEDLPLSGLFVSMGLGFTLSLLFFMDQNISAAMVHSPAHNLTKGCAYHYDLLVVAILNAFLTSFGLPMMHGVLPHSPLHARNLADIEERIENGHRTEVITNVRETRVTGIVSHILIGLSVFLVPYPIVYIPTPVLDGLFLYMAVTSLGGIQMFERILLLFMEQSAYPPNHYIRRCPQRKIHEFTLVQVFQLGIMCFFGFSPSNTIEMFFPVIILLLLPFRAKAVPYFIQSNYLEALDGKQH
ncbi:Sodium bicarbonate transporter-like protein 11, partial [Fragariocoptes setiger]